VELVRNPLYGEFFKQQNTTAKEDGEENLPHERNLWCGVVGIA
jgi:hypothetical protein